MKSLNDTIRSFPYPGSRAQHKGCRHVRRWYLVVLSRRLGPDAAWVQRHLAACPRCRRRVAGWRKVDLALSIVKSQPHHLDLLRQANASTLKMLTHTLRDASQAKELAGAQSEPSFLERSGSYRHWATHAAACFVILFLAKSGLFASFDRLSTGSENLVRQYYTSHAGDDLAGEMFDS